MGMSDKLSGDKVVVLDRLFCLDCKNAIGWIPEHLYTLSEAREILLPELEAKTAECERLMEIGKKLLDERNKEPMVSSSMVAWKELEQALQDTKPND